MSIQDRITDWGVAPPKKIVPPQCSRCVHLTSRERWTCDAFPAGIPTDILVGDFDHTNPYPGDGGVRFEKAAKSEMRAAESGPDFWDRLLEDLLEE